MNIPQPPYDYNEVERDLLMMAEAGATEEEIAVALLATLIGMLQGIAGLLREWGSIAELEAEAERLEHLLKTLSKINV